MVKRTLVVLGILSLILVMAGTVFAFRGGCGRAWDAWDCAPPPLFVPVDCPKYPVAKMIHTTWQCKIEGPCPARMPMVGCCGRERRGIGLCNLLAPVAAIVGAPFDFLFGGPRGVHRCSTGRRGHDGPCGPHYGPVPAFSVGAVKWLAGSGAGLFTTPW